MGTRSEKQVSEIMNELERITDEVRVKIHLGSMDAKEAWKKLEPKLEEAKSHASAATEESVQALRELAKAVRALGASL